jgi:hypothetical protein
MTPHHLTFSTSRDALCPTCNGGLFTGGWSIRRGLALCLSCAKTTGGDHLDALLKLIASHGVDFFSVSHSVRFFTPPAWFPKTVVWPLWVLSPANTGPPDSQ